MRTLAKPVGKAVVQKDITGPAIKEALKCSFTGMIYVWFSRDIVGAAFYPKVKGSKRTDDAEYAPRAAVLFKCVSRHLVHLPEHPISAGLTDEELVRKIDTARKARYYMRY